MGRMLVVAGTVLMGVGLVVLLAGRLGLPLGRLPGDVSYRGKNFAVFAPIGTSILVSVVLSLLFYLVSALRR